LPVRIQVDNGHPWGLKHGLPQDLALWLIGLGVAVSWIPSGQPQHNGKVERGNGVMQNWADPSQCRNREVLRQRLEQECLIQRERYPAVAGMSRMEAYPGLVHSARPYELARASRLWDLSLVDRFLASRVYHRRANARGAISLYGWPKNLGRAHKGKEVYVRFDPSKREWVVTDHQGSQLKRLPAPELREKRILALTVGCGRHP
jgi:hypothetical protein